MNLPAGSAGAIVAVSDYARNFSTYNFTISANGSEKIGGVTLIPTPPPPPPADIIVENTESAPGLPCVVDG